MALVDTLSTVGSALWRRLHGDPGPVALPADALPHHQPVEWWYLVGTLEVEGAGRHAFEHTVARVADPLVARVGTWAAVLALIAEQGADYALEERAAARTPLRVENGAWRARFGAGAAAWDFALDPVGATVSLRAENAGGRLVLDGRWARPPARWGDAGVVDYGGQQRLAWWSASRIVLTGTLARPGEAPRAARGLAWLDHQYGAPALGAYRWRVLLLHLDNGEDLLAFSMETRAGAPVSAQAWVQGPAGPPRALTGVVLEAEGPRAPGGTLPGTRLRADGGWDLRARPWFLGQLKALPPGRFQRFPVWWEGAADVAGAGPGGPVRGRGFIEVAPGREGAG